MTIQDAKQSSLQTDLVSSDLDEGAQGKIVPRKCLQYGSCPTVIQSLDGLDLTEVKEMQRRFAARSRSEGSVGSKTISTLNQSNSVKKSPRTVLKEKREKVAQKKFVEPVSRLSVDQLLKRCPSRDHIPQNAPITLEQLSTSKFDMNKYQSMKHVKRKRARSFNKKFTESIEAFLKEGHLQPIDESFINDYVKANVTKKVDTFLNRIDDFSLVSIEDLEKCCPLIARQCYREFCNKEHLYTFVHRNLLSMKVMIGINLDSLKWSHRSEWLDELVEALQLTLNLGSFSTSNYQLGKTDVESLEFYETFLNNCVNDPDIRSLLMKAVHPNEAEAQKTLERLSFWGADEGYCEIFVQVRKAMHLYLKHHNAQQMTTKFDECFFSKDFLEKVDWAQVARSYIMHNKRNYSVLKVNDRDIKDTGIFGNSTERCQLKFFNGFLKILYQEGGYAERVESMAQEEAELFLKCEPFLGREILLAGSNNSWAFCDGKLRQMYPLLFNDTYKTRMNQGIKCYIQIESSDKYSILVNKTYTTYPRPEGITSKDSFAIDDSRPLCGIQICWQIDYDVEKGWSHSISSPLIQRKKANDDEWEGLLEIILAPFPVDGGSGQLPKNDLLKDLLETI